MCVYKPKIKSNLLYCRYTETEIRIMTQSNPTTGYKLFQSSYIYFGPTILFASHINTVMTESTKHKKPFPVNFLENYSPT